MSNWNNDYDPNARRENETLGYEPYRRQQGPNWYAWAPMLAAGAVLVAAASFFTARAMDGDPQPQVTGAATINQSTSTPTAAASGGTGETPAAGATEPMATPTAGGDPDTRSNAAAASTADRHADTGAG